MQNTGYNNSATDTAQQAIGMLHAVLDQVDYGVAVVDADTRSLLLANKTAQHALAPASAQPSGLCVADGRLCVRQHAHAERLTLALLRTKTHVRGLLSFGEGGCETPIAVMPLSASTMPGAVPIENTDVPRAHYALLLFSKPQLCDSASITLFASDRGLTNAEALVLAQVCKGLRPTEIAVRHGVQVCTVRSQLRSIRQKTASDSIRELVEKVSVLPPLARQVSTQISVQSGLRLALTTATVAPCPPTLQTLPATFPTTNDTLHYCVS